MEQEERLTGQADHMALVDHHTTPVVHTVREAAPRIEPAVTTVLDMASLADTEAV